MKHIYCTHLHKEENNYILDKHFSIFPFFCPDLFFHNDNLHSFGAILFKLKKNSIAIKVV